MLDCCLSPSSSGGVTQSQGEGAILRVFFPTKNALYMLYGMKKRNLTIRAGAERVKAWPGNTIAERLGGATVMVSLCICSILWLRDVEPSLWPVPMNAYHLIIIRLAARPGEYRGTTRNCGIDLLGMHNCNIDDRLTESTFRRWGYRWRPPLVPSRQQLCGRQPLVKHRFGFSGCDRKSFAGWNVSKTVMVQLLHAHSQRGSSFLVSPVHGCFCQGQDRDSCAIRTLTQIVLDRFCQHQCREIL